MCSVWKFLTDFENGGGFMFNSHILHSYKYEQKKYFVNDA